MAKLRNVILEKMQKENRISHMPKEDAQRIYIATGIRHEKYIRKKRKI